MRNHTRTHTTHTDVAGTAGSDRRRRHRRRRHVTSPAGLGCDVELGLIVDRRRSDDLVRTFAS